MSPKPVDVSRALRTLRRECPTPEQTERLLRALGGSFPSGRGRGGVRPRSVARPLALTLIAAALTAVIFTPRRGAGSAWAQTLDATLGAPNSHAVLRHPGWGVQEEWRSGPRRAYAWLDKRGRPVMEGRTDGRRRMRLFRTKALTPANQRAYAVLDKPTKTPKGADLPFTELDELLKQPNLVVVSHEEAAEGHPEIYRLRVTKPLRADYVAEIDPQARRIRRLLSPQYGSVQTFDYPDAIPAKAFDPTPPKGVEVYDVAAQNALIEKRQRAGLGRSGPVTLRLVLLDGQGRLWAVWTGGLDHLPPMGLSGPIRPISVPASKPQGTGLTFPDGNGALARTMVVPRAKIGSTVGLEIPYPGGVARFPRAPVLRVGSIYDYPPIFRGTGLPLSGEGG